MGCEKKDKKQEAWEQKKGFPVGISRPRRECRGAYMAREWMVDVGVLDGELVAEERGCMFATTTVGAIDMRFWGRMLAPIGCTREEMISVSNLAAAACLVPKFVLSIFVVTHIATTLAATSSSHHARHSR